MNRTLRILLRAGAVLLTATVTGVASAAITTFGNLASVSGRAHTQGPPDDFLFESTDSAYRVLDQTFYHEVLDLSAKGPSSLPAAASYALDAEAAGTLGPSLSLRLHDTLAASVNGCGGAAYCRSDAGQVTTTGSVREYTWAFELTDTNYRLDVSALSSSTFANAPAGASITTSFSFTGAPSGTTESFFEYLVTDFGNGTSNGSASPPVSRLLSPGLYQMHARTTLTGLESLALLPSTLGHSSTLDLAITPVPLPAAAWLMLSGLGGIAAVAWRRQRQRRGATNTL